MGLHPAPASDAKRYVFDRAPLRVYWELTRACELACRHCRAEAVPRRHPGELDTLECATVLDQLAAFGAPLPHVVFTGGDPFERPDLFELIALARARGFRVSVSPSATPLLTAAQIARLRAAGVDAISLSLDGATAERHDAIRGVAGTFERTLAVARAAETAGLLVQVNTLVAEETLDDLPAIHRLAQRIGAARWSLFFLVQTGRGAVLRQISAQACEELMNWLAGLPRGGKPLVTTTEAPHYRRVLFERTGRRGGHGGGVRDGNGILFISHTGEVYPSGFLPLEAGNVREASLAEIYRDTPVFRDLRRPEAFTGRCGRCPFCRECGGSRARAYAATGDPLGDDPLCGYEPGPTVARPPARASA